MDSTIVATFLTTAGGVVIFFTGHYAGRKKTEVEVKNIQATTEKTEAEEDQIRLNNLKNTIAIYERVHGELSRQLDNVSKKCTELSLEISALREENKTLTLKITEASNENKLLKQELHLFKEKLTL